LSPVRRPHLSQQSGEDPPPPQQRRYRQFDVFHNRYRSPGSRRQRCLFPGGLDEITAARIARVTKALHQGISYLIRRENEIGAEGNNPDALLTDMKEALSLYLEKMCIRFPARGRMQAVNTLTRYTTSRYIQCIMAIQSFSDRNTERFFTTGVLGKGIGWASVIKIAGRKLDMIHYATRLDDLRAPPGNRMEALSGDLQGFHSIRINDQWRIVFRWMDTGPCDVRITDYHA
jgi:proteic killer suppression protein